MCALTLAFAVFGLNSCGKGGDKARAKPRVAYMGNAIAPFWTIAEKGARKAAAEFGADVEVRMPGSNRAADQKRMVEELLAMGVDGIAFSPADPENQLDLMQEIAQEHESHHAGQRCAEGAPPVLRGHGQLPGGPDVRKTDQGGDARGRKGDDVRGQRRPAQWGAAAPGHHG